MEQRRKTNYYCCVSGCSNSSLNSEFSFFKLPADLERRTRWLELIDQDDIIDANFTRVRVCEAHFTPDSVTISEHRRHLKKTALPQLLLPIRKTLHKGIQTKVITVNQSVQCNCYFRVNSQTQTPLHLLKNIRGKKQLLSEIKTCRERKKIDIVCNTQSEMSMLHELCDKLLAKNLARIIKEQSKTKALQTGNRFSLDYNFFCMNLYYISPQAYSLLKNTLCLPSKPTLMKMHIPVSTKTDNHLLDVLKTKVHYMGDMDRQCTLVIDAVGLKMNLFYNIREDKIYGFHEVDGVQSPEPAKFALVAMIQGLFKNYKQLVGFALLAEYKHYESVSDWIDKLILKLFSIGLNVRILVSDMASDLFFNSARSRSVSAERPYFFVGDRKIYHIFDTRHLIKLVRNDLMNYEFHFEKNVAKWQHIIEFYALDKLKRLRLAPKLTENHMKPTKLEGIKVKYAVQVFSASVAAGLSTYKDFGLIEYSSEGTIKLIEVMNDLFDFLNTSSRYGQTQYQNAFCGEEYQISFINKMLNFLASLKVINPSNGQNVTTKVKFIEGFQITLRSLLLLVKELKFEGLSFNIPTKRLNNECTENFFGQIKKKKENSTKSTSWQLVSSFKKLFFKNILKSPNSGSCAEAIAKCLLDWETLYASSARQKRDPETLLKMASNKEEKEENSKTNLMPSIPTTLYNKLDLPKDNALVYISGYLLKKCLDQHKECNDHIADTKYGNPLKFLKDASYAHYKNYIKDGAKDVLAIPPDSFVEFVRIMEERFCIFFKIHYRNCSVLNSILNEVQLLTFPMPCKCFPVAYCKRLYMRMRIYLSLKDTNRAIKQGGEVTVRSYLQ